MFLSALSLIITELDVVGLYYYLQNGDRRVIDKGIYLKLNKEAVNGKEK